MALRAAPWRLLLHPAGSAEPIDVTARTVAVRLRHGCRVTGAPHVEPSSSGTVELANADRAFTVGSTALLTDEQLDTEIEARLETRAGGRWDVCWTGWLTGLAASPRRPTASWTATSGYAVASQDQATVKLQFSTLAELVAAVDGHGAAHDAERRPAARMPRLALAHGTWGGADAWRWPDPPALSRSDWLFVLRRLTPALCWIDRHGGVRLLGYDRLPDLDDRLLDGHIADEQSEIDNSIAPNAYRDIDVARDGQQRRWQPAADTDFDAEFAAPPAPLGDDVVSVGLAWWAGSGMRRLVTQPMIDGTAPVEPGELYGWRAGRAARSRHLCAAVTWTARGGLLMRTAEMWAGFVAAGRPFVVGSSLVGSSDVVSARGESRHAPAPFAAAGTLDATGTWRHLVIDADTHLTALRDVSLQIIAIGGGGGGGGGSSTSSNLWEVGGGGGGGGIVTPAVAVKRGDSVDVAVGAGGPGGILGVAAVHPRPTHAGSDGGDTVVTAGSAAVTAGGGGGGAAAGSSAPRVYGRAGRPQNGSGGGGGGSGSQPGSGDGAGHDGGGGIGSLFPVQIGAGGGGGGILGDGGDGDPAVRAAGAGGPGWVVDLDLGGSLVEHSRGGDGAVSWAASAADGTRPGEGGQGARKGTAGRGTDGGDGAGGLVVLRWRDDGDPMAADDLLTVS